MNDDRSLENELRRLRPAALPEALQRRLLAVPERAPALRAGRAAALRTVFSRLADHFSPWPHAWRWAPAPVCALALAAAFLWTRSHLEVSGPKVAAADFAPDSVTLSEEVLARYDGGIVQRPDGEVVRLTCYDRINRVILKDSRRGSVVERRAPERDIIPVHLDVY